MARALEQADDVLNDLWWGDASRKVREGGWTPSGATRGSDPEDYRSVAQAEAAGRAAGEQAAATGNLSAGASNSAPSKPPPPQDDNSYAGQGSYRYRVDPATGDIFIVQSGYGGNITDYSAAPKKVARGSTAYNAIVAELNRMYSLGLRPVQAAKPAGQGAKSPPPPPPPKNEALPPPPPPKNEAPPRTGPAPAGDAWFNMEADAATRPSAASAVNTWFDMEGDAATRSTAAEPETVKERPPANTSPPISEMTVRRGANAPGLAQSSILAAPAAVGSAIRQAPGEVGSAILGAPAYTGGAIRSAASAVYDFLNE